MEGERKVPEFELERNHLEKYFGAKLLSSGTALGQWFKAHFPVRICKITYIMLPKKVRLEET